MCPRCKKSFFNELTFYMKPQRHKLRAYCCKVCGFLWSSDEEMLLAVRKHLKFITSTNARAKLDEK